MMGVTGVNLRVHLTKTVPSENRVWTMTSPATASRLFRLSSSTKSKGLPPAGARADGVVGGEKCAFLNHIGPNRAYLQGTRST